MGTTYHSNDVGSVILGRPAPAPLPSRGGGGRRGGHFKLWSASLRRIVLDAVRCGGQQKHAVKVDTLVPEPEISVTTLRSELKKQNNGTTATATANAAVVNHIVSGSEKLSDLLRQSEFSEKENEEQHEEEEEEEVKKKVEALEELKKSVRKLQGNSNGSQNGNGNGNGNDLIIVIEGAKEIRKLTKDDSEARTTLALLGAIPPLVALLDSPDLSSQIAVLYALLNLGIGNDA